MGYTPGDHPMGWLVAYIGDAGTHLYSLPSIARLTILIAVLLALGNIQATRGLALWAGSAILLISIFYGV